MSRRHYNNNAAVVQTTGALTSGATSVTVSDASSFPASFPWTATIDAGTASAEVVEVTAAAGATLTIVRGFDGTAAQAHAANAAFTHEAVAADYDEANAHINAVNNVHGVVGNVVGTSDTQTLTNKTLTAPAISSPAFSGTATGLTASSATLSGAALSAPTITGGLTVDSISASSAVSALSFSTGGSITGNSSSGVTSVGALKTVAFASTAARDAAITSPTAGMIVFVTGVGLQVRGATAWNTVAGTA